MTIIIPAYKPDEKLISLLENLRENSPARLILVNDGSGAEFDPIFEKATPLCDLVLSHDVNRGKGAALKTAFSYLLEEGKETGAICTADADGQHLPKDILRCLHTAEEHRGSLVLGSRSFKGNVPLRSRFGNSASRLTFRLLMGKGVYDTQTGLRAFTPELLPLMLKIPHNRYEYEMQMLCDAVRKKIPIEEITIETVYLEENKSSHFNPLKDAMRVYSLLLRCALGPVFEILSFLFSSCFAYLVDFFAYSAFLSLLFPLFLEPGSRSLVFLSLLAARIISSAANFFVNGKLVFKSLEKPARSMILYFLLVIFIFFANEKLNALFLLNLNFNVFFSHGLSQCICFPISFLAQKYIVFPRNKEKK